MRSQNRTKCVKYVWLSYSTWPSRWVLCISMQWLRLKGCHVACYEWESWEICSLQHMWVTGSVMWAAASDESLKFGVQGASATNWFPRVNGMGFDCSKPAWIYLFEKSCQHRDFVSMAVIFYICKPNTSLTVNALLTVNIGLWSLFDKNWNGLTGYPSLSLLNYRKDQCRSDKTAILNTLTGLIVIVN